MSTIAIYNVHNFIINAINDAIWYTKSMIKLIKK